MKINISCNFKEHNFNSRGLSMKGLGLANMANSWENAILFGVLQRNRTNKRLLREIY